jgi:hypothetical protein
MATRRNSLPRLGPAKLRRKICWSALDYGSQMATDKGARGGERTPPGLQVCVPHRLGMDVNIIRHRPGSDHLVEMGPPRRAGDRSELRAQQGGDGIDFALTHRQ